MLTEPESLAQVSEIIDSSVLTKYAAKEAYWLKVEKYIASADSLELAPQGNEQCLVEKI